MQDYEFHVPPLLLIGPGSYRRTAEAIQGLGVGRVLVVTDRFLHGLEYTQEILESLRQAGLGVAVFDDIPITAIMTMESTGTGTRYVFTALHRNEADLTANKESGFYEGTMIAVDQFVAHVMGMKK